MTRPSSRPVAASRARIRVDPHEHSGPRVAWTPVTRSKGIDPVETISLDGAVSFVTGAGSGMGESIARELAARGGVVVVADIEKEARRRRWTVSPKSCGPSSEDQGDPIRVTVLYPGQVTTRIAASERLRDASDRSDARGSSPTSGSGRSPLTKWPSSQTSSVPWSSRRLSRTAPTASPIPRRWSTLERRLRNYAAGAHNIPPA